MGLREEYDQRIGAYIQYGRAVSLLASFENVTFSYAATWLLKLNAHKAIPCYSRNPWKSGGYFTGPSADRDDEYDELIEYFDYSPPHIPVKADGPHAILTLIAKKDNLWWEACGEFQVEIDGNQRWKRDEFWSFVTQHGVTVTEKQFSNSSDCPLFIRVSDLQLDRSQIESNSEYRGSAADWRERALRAEAALHEDAPKKTTDQDTVKNRDTLLSTLKKKGFPLSLLGAASKTPRTQQLASYILESASINEKSTLPWRYKSILDLGIEQFVADTSLHWIHKLDSNANLVLNRDNWAEDAASTLQSKVIQYIHYEPEGLVLYHDSGNGFRPATKSDRDYDFAVRLRDEGALEKIDFLEPPEWTRSLYVEYGNFQAYSLVWFDSSDKAEKIELVRRETRRRTAKNIDGESFFQINPTYSTDEFPVFSGNESTSPNANPDHIAGKTRAMMLQVIGGLILANTDTKLHGPRIEGFNKLWKDLQSVGVMIGDDTLRGYLKEAAPLLMKPND